MVDENYRVKRIYRNGPKPVMTLRKALNDRALLGNILDGPSWDPWKTLLIASQGEPLINDTERAIFSKFTNRTDPPNKRCEEFVVVKGRRAGGSRSFSVLAAYQSALCTWPSLVAGEKGVLLIIAADSRQSAVILDYTVAAFEQSPILRQLIAGRTARELRLTNGITIESRPADFRNLRGISFISVFGDETAFLRTEGDSPNPDVEILNACRPGLASTGGSMYLISSPYAKRGELYELYKSISA